MSLSNKLRPLIEKLRAKTQQEEGSMPLALFLIVSTTIIALISVSVMTWQVAQTRNEQLAREAQLAVDSTMNFASETLGASGRALLGIPVEEPGEWTESSIYGVATKWWAIPLNSQDIARTVTPTPFTYTASSGTLAVSLDVNGDVYLTSDGVSWVKTGKSPIPSNSISDFTYGRGYFIMTARPNSSTPLGSIVYYSANGKDWFAAAFFGTSPDSLEKIAKVACSSTSCVMITGDRDTRTRYWFSPDLNSWSAQGDTDSDMSLPVAFDIEYGANRWLAVGNNGTTNEYAFSTDGATWSTKNSVHAPGAADPVTQLTYSESTGFVGVLAGFNNATNYPGYVDAFGNTDASSSFIRSADGINWTVGILPVAQHWSQIASDNETVFLIGESESTSLIGGTSVALSTRNGTDWNTRSLPRADNYSAVAPVGSSWLITSPLSVYGYLASAYLNRPTLPNEIYLKAVATTSANSVGTTFNKVYRFKWSENRNRWELNKTYTDLEFDLAARFSILPDDGKVELLNGEASFNFLDASAGSPSSWSWDFGDGSSSSDQNPTKTYLTSGTYTVRLTVTEPGGYSNTFAETIRVQEPPAEPRNVTVQAGNTGLVVAWAAPVSDGQARILEYNIRYRPSGTLTWTTINVSGDKFSRVLSGLTERDSYEVQVSARNSIGNSGWSSTNSASPYQPPSSPTGLQVTGLVDQSISFDAPVDTGGLPISGYRVQSATDENFTQGIKTIDIRNRAAFVRHFDEFTTYYLRVFAINNAGLSAPTSTATFTTIGRPTEPTSATTTATDDEIVVDWNAPSSNGGSGVTGYLVEYTEIENDFDAGTRTTTTNESFSFASEPGVAYYVRVSAVSAAGRGNPTPVMSAVGNSVVQTIPGLTATGQSESVLIQWTQPTIEQMGGSAIQSYTLTWSSPNGTFNSVTVPSSTTGILVDEEDNNGDGLADGALSAGVSYTFALTATNGVGARTFNVSGTPTS